MDQRRHPRTVEEIHLDDGIFRADLELNDRSQMFATEMVRLALLALAGLGFLVVNVALSDQQGSLGGGDLRALSPWLMGAVVGLVCALGFALFHRFYSTDYVTHHIVVVRLLKQLASAGYSANEQDEMRRKLSREKAREEVDMRMERLLNRLAAVALIVGTAFIAILLTRIVTLAG
jgi:hypothetical protein